ncbi:hypothetical protein I6J71_40100 [Amycolatopsis sp. FDAARGOS 1241]|nr:hypothetical protein I6J71_40100 [Amycolatopsis sp. FDAARGOS 1241]
MGGSRYSSHPDTVTAAEVTMPGRHRARGGPGAQAWTPVVPADSAGHHRHRPGAAPASRAADPRAGFAPAQGTLPVPSAAESWLPQPTWMHEERGAFTPAVRGRTELPQPGRNDRGFTAGRLDEAEVAAGGWAGDLPQPSRGHSTPAADPADFADAVAEVAASGWGTAQPGASAFTPAPPDFDEAASGWSTGSQPSTSAFAGDPGAGPRPGPSGQAAGAEAATSRWTQSGDLGDLARVSLGRRVPNGRAVVPDPQPVSEIDRAWAAPGTTRSLADVQRDRLAQPQARRTRRERVEATAATLAHEAAARESVEPSTQPEPPRRQRVTLRAPAVRVPEPDDEEVRVYAAPLLDGLGKFDLGSVPASVTPPKTWRKAAWFATGASGAVVVGLLFAGTFLVGGPTTTTDALGGGWPGRQNGGNPLMLPDPSVGGYVGTSGDSRGSRSIDRDSGTSSSDDPDTRPQNAAGTSSSSDEGTPANPSSEDSSSPGATAPTSTPPSAPEKPPVTPAQRETAPATPWYSSPKDTKKMGDYTEQFFNTVTTDPAEASAVTTGDLKSEGPQGLRQRYAKVAYFEVKKVEIDPDDNTTVNTLEVTHTDGTKTVEQRTLTFGDDEKIADDGV